MVQIWNLIWSSLFLRNMTVHIRTWFQLDPSDNNNRNFTCVSMCHASSWHHHELAPQSNLQKQYLKLSRSSTNSASDQVNNGCFQLWRSDSAALSHTGLYCASALLKTDHSLCRKGKIYHGRNMKDSSVLSIHYPIKKEYWFTSDIPKTSW